MYIAKSIAKSMLAQRQRQKEKIANDFVAFRKKYLFRQVDLAEQLKISRRGLQMIENASYLPILRTQKRFAELKRNTEEQHD